MTEAERKEWFLGATEAVAKEVWQAMRESRRHPHWIYFVPGRQLFYVVPEGHPVPDGSTRAADTAVPVTLPSMAHVTAWIRWKTQGLPLFPVAERPS